MGKITVSRRSGGDKDGRSQLYVVVYISRETIRIATGIKVLETEWDAEHERVKGKNANDLNLIIEQMKAKINNIQVKVRLRDEKLTKENFLRYFECPTQFDCFLDFMTYYYNKVQRVKEENTLKSYRTIMRKMREFAPKASSSKRRGEGIDGIQEPGTAENVRGSGEKGGVYRTYYLRPNQDPKD